ncbi:MAG: penicillin acylase family protein [Candidatus Cyclobacteriaceae bacterium M2_1C_046]
MQKEISSFLILTLIISFAGLSAKSQPTDNTIDPEKTAKEVTIFRDNFGVPHIYGKTDEATVFGLAYARAEDQFEAIEHAFIKRLGRAAEVDGEKGLYNPDDSGYDILVHAYQINEMAKQEYENLSPKLKKICDAYATGLNYYLEKNPQQEVKLLHHFEPWYVIANSRSWWWLSRAQSNLSKVEVEENGEFQVETNNRGSNTWAIGPNKTANGSTMLLINPHISMDIPQYEVHLMSDEDLNINGIVGFGTFIFPYAGFNENLGWSVTVNEPDVVDSYKITFDHPSDPLKYRFGDEYLTAEVFTKEIKIKTDSGVISRPFSFKKTVHGPILKEGNGQAIAYRMAGVDTGGLLEQMYEMAKAKNLQEWKNAVSKTAISSHNLMYADREGNIFYLYNGNIPVRDTTYNWKEILDGSDPGTFWKGYHPIDQLPQLLNPPTNYLQNCNTSPFNTTNSINPDPADYPAYMTYYEDTSNLRSIRSKQLLEKSSNLTLNSLQELIMDTYNTMAETYIEMLESEWLSIKNEDPVRYEKLKEPVQALINWNRYSNKDSYETTLYTLWADGMISYMYENKGVMPAQLDAYERGIDILIKHFGNWRIPYRNIVRHQRLESNNYSVDPDKPSYPTDGNLGSFFGTMFCMNYSFYNGKDVTRRVRRGNSYVSIIEFGEEVKAKSILNYGQSSRPNSPHYIDQAEMFANGEMKPVLFKMEDILNNLKVKYHPGEENK